MQQVGEPSYKKFLHPKCTDLLRLTRKNSFSFPPTGGVLKLFKAWAEIIQSWAQLGRERC